VVTGYPLFDRAPTPPALPAPAPAVPAERLAAAQDAADHADREHGGAWAADAMRHLLDFASRAPAPWLAEDALATAIASGLPEPPDRRAWGAVVSTAARRGLIRRVEFRLDHYGSPKSRWSIA